MSQMTHNSICCTLLTGKHIFTSHKGVDFLDLDEA